MTSTLPALPEGLTSRALQQSDARAVYQLMAADQLDQLGHAEIEEADIVGDWARPSFDVAASTMGVFDDGRLVGYAEVTAADRGDAAVHPDYRGRGIGTALARWMQDRADTPWYSSVRLIRQPEAGAWQPVLAEVVEALHQKRGR